MNDANKTILETWVKCSLNDPSAHVGVGIILTMIDVILSMQKRIEHLEHLLGVK